MIDDILIYPLITAALYYLGARAMITKFLWEHYSARTNALMNCAACAGTWYGVMCGAFGLLTRTPFLGSTAWWTVPVIALAAMVWTPILAAKHEAAMYRLMGEPPRLVILNAQYADEHAVEIGLNLDDADLVRDNEPS